MAVATEAELNEEFRAEAEANEKIKTLLTGFKAQYKVVRIGEIELKIKPTIPKSIRHEMDQLQDNEELKKLSNVEELTYRMIAEMCMEDEFKDPRVWKLIDEDTGNAFDLLSKIYEEANNSHAQIKRFR